MLFYIAKRIMHAIWVMLIVTFFAFSIFNYVGNPAYSMIDPSLGVDPTEEIARIEKQLGLDQPFYIQYARFLNNIVHGDFGYSIAFKQPVVQLIWQRIPATLELVILAMLIVLALGIPLGVYTGINPDSNWSKGILFISLIGLAIPTFVVCILLIFFFSVTLDWLPAFGRGTVVQIGSWSTGLLTASGLKSLILPVIALILPLFSWLIRLVRAEIIEVMQSDYIKFAVSRGLPTRSIYFRHALKNSLLPVITVMGIVIANNIVYSAVAELVFQWPGLGILFLQAINFADMPFVTAYLLIVAFVFVIVNLSIDILYVFIDPRLRRQLRR